MSLLHLRLSQDSPCEWHWALCLAAEHGPDPDPTRHCGGLCVDIVCRDTLGLSTFLHQKVALGPLGSWAHSPQRKRRCAASLSSGALMLRFAGRISGFGRVRLKFAGAAF